PIALHAPFFGLERDLTVAPDHRLLVWGADAEYLFGAEEVLIEARYLNRFASGLPKHRPATQRYVHVLIGSHVCLSVGGGWGESLYLGDLADHPARHAMSPLRRIPSSELPRHTAMVGPELGGYEAAVLVSSLCA
ncbi:MAG: Hint domain-containing protein, partial [Pseudomonadota bacterium]